MAKGKANVNYLNREGLVAHQNAPDWDFLYSASTVKDPNWNLGDRVVLPDGRAFRYAKCGSTLESMKFFVFSYNPLVAEKTSPTCVPTATVAVGAKSAAFTVTAGKIGVNRDGVIAADELRGGYISFYGSSSDRQQRGIIGNTALAATGTSITIYFDAPIVTAMAASTATEILANPYSDVRKAAGGQASALGLPNVVATTGQYFWIQTWGICRLSPDSNDNSGFKNNMRQFYVDQYGLSQMPASYDETKASRQAVGFVVERSDGVSGDTAPFVNLQINP